jgi:uncharacterized protein YabN with tetrapyrrole methylase and pyrophosphatase domain
MALRETNSRFRKRFGYIEAQAARQGRNVDDLSFEEMDALWEEAKHQSLYFAREWARPIPRDAF